MSGVRKPSPESSVPGENLPRGSRRNQLRRGHGSPPVLGEVPHELSSAMHFTERECAPQTLSSPAAPYRDNPPRDERLIYTSHHPVRRPYRRRPHLLNYQLNILFKSRENHTPHCRSGRHGCQVPDWIPDCRKNKDTSVRRPERTAKEHGQTSCYG